MFPVIDLHCDLLSFLAESPLRTIDDPLSKASYPQMKQGGVSLQALAIFTKSTKGSLAEGNKQIQVFLDLLKNQPTRYQLWEPKNPVTITSPISIVPAFENAYGFAEDGEPIEKGLAHLDNLLRILKRILYISLTWDGENRFGGGNGSKKGLKEDGMRILEWMSEKKIAIDLSHTSDFLADDIFNYMNKKSLQIPVMASHSNARAVTNKERNLPDSIIKEIFKRKGLIGLNLFSPFVGKEAKEIVSHVAHFLDLGGENNLCFGADFFPELDFAYLKNKYQITSCFFPELADASCYGKTLALIQKTLSLHEKQIEKISHKNFENAMGALYL